MKAVWTPPGIGAQSTTLGDDAGGIRMKLETLGGAGVEQMEQLAFATAVYRKMRGNLAGDLVLQARKSHATRDAAMQYFVGMYALIGQGGTMVLTFDAATMTMANATFKGVTAVEFNGLEWALRYTIGITTITSP